MLPSPKFIWNGAFINVTQHYSRVFVDLLLTLAPSSISGHPPLLYPVSHRLASGNGIVDFCPLSRLYILPPRLLTCSTSLHPSPHPYENSSRLRREAACGCLTARMPRMRCQAVPADSVTHVRHTVVWAVWTGWAGTASGISFRKTKKGTRTLRPLKITRFRRQVTHNETGRKGYYKCDV